MYNPALLIEQAQKGNHCCAIFFPSRHLDTSLIDVDVQPTYVRVTVKGKVPK